MRTEMDDAKPHAVRLISARKVVFTFDLRDNESLRSKALVERSMAGLMLTYKDVKRYEAEYFGNWLVISVYGTVSRDIVTMYL